MKNKDLQYVALTRYQMQEVMNIIDGKIEDMEVYLENAPEDDDIRDYQYYLVKISQAIHEQCEV